LKCKPIQVSITVLVKGFYGGKDFSLRMGRMGVPEKLNLADFAGIVKAGTIIWKNMLTGMVRHFIKLFLTTLGQYNRIGGFYGCHIGRIGIPTGANDILIGLK
jgi:hypothetical protein